MFVVCLLMSYREGGYIWNAKIITRPDFYRDICWNDNRRNRSTCLDKNTNALFFVLDEVVSQTWKALEGIALVALALHHLLQQLSWGNENCTGWESARFSEVSYFVLESWKNLTQSWTSWWCWAPVTFSTCFVFTGTVSQGEHKEAELATACYTSSAFPPCQMFPILRTTFKLCFVVFFAFVCRSLLRMHRAKCLNRGLCEQAA